MKKLFACILTILLCVVFINPTIAYSATVKLNKTKLTLDEGKSYTLKLTGTTKKPKWTTSNKKVATVSSSGVVKGIAPGTATITATVSSKNTPAR